MINRELILRAHVDVSRVYRKDRDRADNFADLARGRLITSKGEFGFFKKHEGFQSLIEKLQYKVIKSLTVCVNNM